MIVLDLGFGIAELVKQRTDDSSRKTEDSTAAGRGASGLIAKETNEPRTLNIGRSMFDVQSVHCSVQVKFH